MKSFLLLDALICCGNIPGPLRSYCSERLDRISAKEVCQRRTALLPRGRNYRKRFDVSLRRVDVRADSKIFESITQDRFLALKCLRVAVRGHIPRLPCNQYLRCPFRFPVLMISLSETNENCVGGRDRKMTADDQKGTNLRFYEISLPFILSFNIRYAVLIFSIWPFPVSLKSGVCDLD